MAALNAGQLEALTQALGQLEEKLNGVAQPRQILYSIILLNDILTLAQAQAIFNEAKTQILTALTDLTMNVTNFTLI